MHSQSNNTIVEAVDTTRTEVKSLRELRGELGFHLGAACALAVIVTSCTLVIPFQMFVLRFLPEYWLFFPRALSRIVTQLVGVETEVKGTPEEGPVLFASNHISWLDIPIIGACTKAAFIAKSEVRTWGGISIMARLYRCVFVDRNKRHSSATQRDEIASRLSHGDSLILFAEGTSTDGTQVRPFKSALFAVAKDRPGLRIQPVTIAYTHINNMPISRSWRPMIGWYGDMELTSHIWQVLRLGKIKAVIQFHEPIIVDEETSRKDLALKSQKMVSQGLAKANSGRLDENSTSKDH